MLTATTELREILSPQGDLWGWEKTLEYVLPNGFASTNEIRLDFSMTHLGLGAELNVEVEDREGNVQTGKVYLADDWICR